MIIELATMPAWVQLLVGVYWTRELPARWSERCLALTAVFADVAPDVLNAAVRAYLANERFMPQPADLRRYVDHAAFSQDLELRASQAEAAASRAATLTALRAERETLHAAGARSGWFDLAARFEAGGWPDNAAYCRSLAARYEDGADD